MLSERSAPSIEGLHPLEQVSFLDAGKGRMEKAGRMTVGRWRRKQIRLEGTGTAAVATVIFYLPFQA